MFPKVEPWTTCTKSLGELVSSDAVWSAFLSVSQVCFPGLASSSASLSLRMPQAAPRVLALDKKQNRSSSVPAFPRLYPNGLSYVTLLIPTPVAVGGDDIRPDLGCLYNHSAKTEGQSHPNLRLWEGRLILKIRLQLQKDSKLDAGLAKTRNAFYKAVYMCSFSYFLDIYVFIGTIPDLRRV